jgi:hypothetical protein
MLSDWRAGSLASVELWAIGPPAESTLIEALAGESTAPCLIDNPDPDLSAFARYDARKDYLFVIDDRGWIRYRTDLAAASLYLKVHRDDLDRVVRDLLADTQ